MISKVKKNQQVMVPIHIKITEEMRDLLTQVAKSHGFPRIQGLIRLYIRRGLDAENVGYSPVSYTHLTLPTICSV